MLAFSKNLHTDLDVAIGRREDFGATGREAISAQNIDFLDVAIDEKSEEISEKDVANDSTTNFGDARDDETEEIDFDSETCETTDFDFLTCRVRICS